MDVSTSVGALTSAVSSGGGIQETLAATALKSAEQEQASVLQLFNPATAVPPPESGRGQHLNITA